MFVMTVCRPESLSDVRVVSLSLEGATASASTSGFGRTLMSVFDDDTKPTAVGNYFCELDFLL